VRWQEAKRTRESKIKKVGGRRIPPERIVLIWKYIQKHIQILLACLGPIYLQWQHTEQGKKQSEHKKE
jgi:hypothetical protein